MQNTEEMTLGMWVDYVIEWNNMNSRDNDSVDSRGKRNVRRKAGQADFDNF